MTRVPPNKRDMGMVFQAYSLFPNMNAARNVEYGLRIRGTAQEEREAKVAELLELVGLGHAGDRYPHQLSGGMQQRVALARALAIEPRVLLLDEPLSALDAKVRVQLREEIRRIQSRLGITTIYVTHDQEEALSISDRVAVLSQGRIEQIGAPAEIYGVALDAVRGRVRRHDEPARGHGRRPQRARSTTAGCGSRSTPSAAAAPASACSCSSGPRRSSCSPRTANGAAVSRARSISHTFLGAVTRLKVTLGEGEMTADVPASRADVVSRSACASQVRFPSASARLLSL